MDKKYIILIVSLIAVLGISFLIYKSHDIKRTYKAEVLKGLKRTVAIESQLLTKNDTGHLPESVQKYLAYVGVIGKDKVQNVRITCEGEMKMDPQKEWVKVKTEQYNFFDNNLTRMFFIQEKMFGIPIVGLDSYTNGKGNMLIKLAALFTVADARGQEMDKGEAITLFNDMCLLAPATLIDKRIQWDTVDALTAKATFNDNGCKVSAVLYFNDKGELTNFVTDDRYMSTKGNTYKNLRWSTPVRDYKDINGFKLPTYGEGIWHLADGDFCYAKFNIKEVEYNCESFK